MDAVVCASGSSPAYVFIFIEALADSIVKCGMPRTQAYEFVAQTVLGSAKLMRKPICIGELKIWYVLREVQQLPGRAAGKQRF
ncbi:MAG: pyrroline-5-carboxylate reductase dimerization domain-containing protein [Eubacterium sp.]